LNAFRRAILWWAFRCLCRCVATLGRLLYGLEAHGLEHLPPTGPLIIVGRRISRVDFFAGALGSAFLGEWSGMTSAIAIGNSRFIAWVSRELGFLPTLKGKSLSAVLLLEAYKLLRQGKIIAMADEGEVPWDGRLQPFRSGTAWLALRTHAPVAVAIVKGGYDIWPRWARRPHLRGKLIFKLGKPFFLSDAPCDRVTPEMLQQANQRLRDELAAASEGYLLPKANIA
jgi:1-acyl-sn-glycerol-3-phosphate acyltransferase